jgi:hypothetical protein
LGLSHISLLGHYNLNFSLAQHHKYSLTELENLAPFERDLYSDMLISYLNEKSSKSSGGEIPETILQEIGVK